MSPRNFVGILCASLTIVLSPLAGFTKGIEGKGSISVKDVDEKEYSNLAKINLQAAVDKALKQVPGKAIEAELDDEDNFLVYEVKIATSDNKIAEVKVDAGNGNILKFDKESA